MALPENDKKYEQKRENSETQNSNKDMRSQSEDLQVELKNVGVSFFGEVILQNINLKIFRGQKIAIIGPSGQGKTVLLKTIAGLISPSQGEILIEGKNWLKVRGQERQNILNRMGMLFQKNALFDSLTVSENIAFPLRETTSKSAQEIEKIVDSFLEAVGIFHAKNLFPDEISGGMQKRLGIARALALDPEIIFYDDPTAGLDPITSRKIIDLINDLQKKKSSTFLAITNDMKRAYQFADQIWMVVDKNVLVAGNVEQTQAHLDPRIHQFIRGSLDGPLTVVNE